MAKRKTKKSKLRRWLTLLLPAALGILAYLGYFYFLKPEEVPIYQATGSGAVNLTLEPASSSLAANTTTALELKIDTGGAKVTAVKVELAYLPGKCVTPVTVAKGDFLTVVLQRPQVNNNKISFVYAAPPASGGKDGSGTLATITTGPTSGTCLLSFLAGTQVAAVGFTGNALDTASDAAIQLLGASPNPSPSPAVSPSPTPAPSQRPKICSNDKHRQVLIRKFPDFACKYCGICD